MWTKLAIVATIFLLARCQSDTYQAKITVLTSKDSKESTSEYSLDFKINPEKLNPGLVTNVDLYLIDVSEKCTVDGVNDINTWYAAYVKVPSSCSQMEIVRQLQADGADFLFLLSQSDDYSKLNSRAIQIPVFPLSSKSRDVEAFMTKVSDSASEAKKAHPDDKADRLKRNTPIGRLFISQKHRPSTNDHAELSLVYSPANIRSFDFIEAVAPVYEKLKDYLKFEPVVVVYKRQNAASKSRNCYLRTPYCAADPDGDGPYTGAEVVLASLRQKCVYQDDKPKWFTYMKCFSDNCRNIFSDECHEKCLSTAGTSKDTIESCIAKSQIGADENTILKEDYNKMQIMLTNMAYPVLLINQNTYRGNLNSKVVGRAICETLSTNPGVCENFDPEAILGEEQKSSVTYSLLVYFYTLMIALLILALICVCIARRAARREVNDEVKRSVAHYFSMKEVESLQ